MKKLSIVALAMLISGCQLGSLSMKPTSDVDYSDISYAGAGSFIKVIDKRNAEDTIKGYDFEHNKSYRFGDEQLGFDRRLVLEQYLNTHLEIEIPSDVTLLEFSLKHIEPEEVRTTKGGFGSPDAAFGVGVAIGGAVGGLVAEMMNASQTEYVSNGHPYFLCSIKLRTQGKRAIVRYYLSQDYYADLNPEAPFESKEYRQGLKQTIEVCLSRSAESLASKTRFDGFELVQK